MISKMARVVKFLIGAIPVVTVLGIGLLYTSVEIAVINTHFFAGPGS